MRQMRLAKENPNIFSFLCDCPGSGICVLVHEIPDKESGEKPDKDYAGWYFCNKLNLSAFVLDIFQGMFKLEPECIPVPQVTADQREIHRRTQAVMLRNKGFTEEQICIAIGAMCDYADAASQGGYARGYQDGINAKSALKPTEPGSFRADVRFVIK